MRGRHPDEFVLQAEHVPVLKTLLRGSRTAQRVARRAQILLARAEGARIRDIARWVLQDPATVWRVVTRYQERGLDALYDAPRSGRPRGISSLGARAGGNPPASRAGKPSRSRAPRAKRAAHSSKGGAES